MIEKIEMSECEENCTCNKCIKQMEKEIKQDTKDTEKLIEGANELLAKILGEPKFKQLKKQIKEAKKIHSSKVQLCKAKSKLKNSSFSELKEED